MSPYVAQNWENEPTETTPLSAERLEHMETQYDEAMADVDAAYVGFHEPAYGTYLGPIVDGKLIKITDPGSVHGQGLVFGNVAGFGFTGQGGGIYAPFIIYQRYGDFVGGSNADIPETTQGGYVTTAYYGPTIHDSAESFAAAVQMKATGTPYTQAEKVTAFEANVQIEAGVTVTGSGHAGLSYLLGMGSRIITKPTGHADWAMGAKVSAATELNASNSGTLSLWQGYVDDAYNPANGSAGNSHSVYGVNRITTEQGFYLRRSTFGGRASIDMAGSGGSTNAFMRLESPSPSVTRAVTLVAATAGDRYATTAAEAWGALDVGKQMIIPGAGAAGVDLTVTITNWNGTTVWFDTAIVTTVAAVSATVSEKDMRTLSIVGGVSQTQALFEARIDKNAPGWVARISAVGRFMATSEGFAVHDDYLSNSRWRISNTLMTFTDDVNIQFGTGNGTKIGTATTQKLGFWNATPVVRPSAYTQTYSTASKTVAATTAVAVVTTTPTTGAYGFTLAQATALITAVNALITDRNNTTQNVNAIIDDLQAVGLVA